MKIHISLIIIFASVCTLFGQNQDVNPESNKNSNQIKSTNITRNQNSNTLSLNAGSNNNVNNSNSTSNTNSNSAQIAPPSKEDTFTYLVTVFSGLMVALIGLGGVYLGGRLQKNNQDRLLESQSKAEEERENRRKKDEEERETQRKV